MSERARAFAFAAAVLAGLARGEAPLSRLKPCPATPNCVSSRAAGETHGIEPFPFSGNGPEFLARIKAAALSFPRTRVAEEAPGYVRLTVKSAVFGFVDDVELEVDEAAKVVHVRSASRVGSGDFGVNRKRVERRETRLRERRITF